LKKEEKAQFIAEMKQELGTAPSMVLADYRGLTVAQISDLRNRCREAGVQFRVAKNTLLKLAAAGTPMAAMESLLTGPTAVAWHREDPGAPARVLVEFGKIKDNEKLEIKGAVAGGKLLGAQEVKSILATLPTRPQLLAAMAGLLAAGPAKLARLLASGPQTLGRALGALKAEKEKQAA
jgi:large subunit ribosomal protein L10